MKRKISIIFILLFYLIFLHKLNTNIYSNNFAQANVFQTTAQQEVKVVSFNIHFGKGTDGHINLERTVNTLKEIDADIICLQEVERLSARSGFINQAGKIAQELEMDFVFYPSLAYPGFYYGNAILSRYPILETNSVLLTSDTENRTALLAKVQFSEEQSFIVITTHLGLDSGERKIHIQEIAEKLDEINSPIILAGDLNATPSMKEYEAWNTVLNRSNLEQEVHTFFNQEWQIDYIFHSEHFTALDTWTHASDASDHLPLVSLLHVK